MTDEAILALPIVEAGGEALTGRRIRRRRSSGIVADACEPDDRDEERDSEPAHHVAQE